MATAQSYQANLVDYSTPSPDGVNARWTENDPLTTGQSFGEKLLKWFTGLDAEQRYQNAMTENNRRYEQAMLQNQRDYETWFDSTQMQRRVADIKAAGLNPWLALQSGGVSASGQPSSSQPGSGSSAKRGQEPNNSALAQFLVSTAKLIASLA